MGAVAVARRRLGEEQAERALELLSPLIGADARPGQQVRPFAVGRAAVVDPADRLNAALFLAYQAGELRLRPVRGAVKRRV